MLINIKDKMAAIVPMAVTKTDYAVQGYHLDVAVSPTQIVEAAQILDDEKFVLESITGVDWLGEYEDKLKEIAKKKAAAAKAAAKAAADAAEAGEGNDDVSPPPAVELAVEEDIDTRPELEVVYDFSHTDTLCRIVIRCRFDREHPPEIPTISAIIPGANWHERETHDFFGIKFAGHPDLSPLLLPEDADFHPLLKDFKA